MTPPSLSTFFDAIIPYVMGRHTRVDLEARLGPSPSGQLRMEVYAGVVRANLSIAMEAMYDSVKRAADATAEGLWRRLIDDFLDAHPPRHADPNRCGEPFSAFLAERRATVDRDLPAYLEELADFEAIRVRAVTSRVSGRDRTLFTRLYTHDVPAYVDSAGRDRRTAGSEDRPVARPTVAIVFRSARTLKARVVTPSTAELFALARREGELDADLLAQSGLSEADLARAEARLGDWGVL